MKWLRDRPFTSALIVSTLIFAVGWWRTQDLANRDATHNRARIAAEDSIIRALHADLHCITKWANATTARNQTLTPLANKRLAFLFAAIEQSLKGHPVAARHLAHKATMANDAYLRAQSANPIPVPKLSCKLLLKEPSQRPTKTVTKTAPPPKPKTVHVPGPTVTVPGPTTTRTVTAPPGKGHRR